MKTKTLNYLSNKLFFSVDDVAQAAGIKNESAQVLCSRYVKNETFLRLKKNFYILAGNWPRYNRDDYFKIANYLQVPLIYFLRDCAFILRNYYSGAERLV